MKWLQDVDESGSINLLLPNGNVQFTSDFEIEQRGIIMEYVAGQGVDVYSGQESPVLTLLYNRISNHDISIQTLNLTSGHESYIGSMDDINIVVDDSDGFVPVDWSVRFRRVHQLRVFGIGAGAGGVFDDIRRGLLAFFTQRQFSFRSRHRFSDDALASILTRRA